MNSEDARQKRIIRLYQGVRDAAGDIEEILLSFGVLLDGLSEGGKTGKSQRQLLSILRGPLLSPTRKKLRELERDFTELGGNLQGLDDVFDHFQVRNVKGKAAALYQGSKNWHQYWKNNKRNINVLKGKILAKLSISPAGEFYDELKSGHPKKVGEDATSLKTDVNALLSIVLIFRGF